MTGGSRFDVFEIFGRVKREKLVSINRGDKRVAVNGALGLCWREIS